MEDSVRDGTRVSARDWVGDWLKGWVGDSGGDLVEGSVEGSVGDSIISGEDVNRIGNLGGWIHVLTGDETAVRSGLIHFGW